MSELSSLHDGDLDSRQSYRQLHRKDLLPIGDLNSKPQCHLPSKTQRIPPANYQSSRTEEQDGRWTCRTEHLPRRPFDSRGRSSSLDELEEFARNYGPRGGRRGHFRDRSDPRWDFDTEQTRHSPRRFRDDDDGDDWRRRSPPLSPRRRCNTGGSEHYGAGNRPYDDTYLNSVLERKARGRGERGGRGDEDSDTPSKSSKKSSDCYHSRSPTNRPDEDDSLPPYSEVERFRSEEPVERERFRTMEPAMRPFSYTRPNQGVAHTLQERREDKDRGRKLTTHLSRDSLIV